MTNVNIFVKWNYNKLELELAAFRNLRNAPSFGINEFQE
jgi:hypothetical protein